MNKKPSINLHILTADTSLSKHITRIKPLALRTIKHAQKLLPFKQSVDVVVYRYHAPSPELATSGYTPSGNVVWIYSDPAQKGYSKLLDEQLSKSVAHELHHACRSQGPGYGKTLRQALISEGLAGHFEEELTKLPPSKMYTHLTTQELKSLLRKAHSELDSTSFSYDDWFFGNARRKIAPHTGYAMGYWLCQEMITKQPASQLVHIKA
jgi:hypothetical protein